MALNKCELVIQLYPPYVHAYRTTPNALTTTVKGITSDNTTHLDIPEGDNKLVSPDD
jgi:hypothetical protein